jgi:hypothetical protein
VRFTCKLPRRSILAHPGRCASFPSHLCGRAVSIRFGTSESVARRPIGAMFRWTSNDGMHRWSCRGILRQGLSKCEEFSPVTPSASPVQRGVEPLKNGGNGSLNHGCGSPPPSVDAPINTVERSVEPRSDGSPRRPTRFRASGVGNSEGGLRMDEDWKFQPEPSSVSSTTWLVTWSPRLTEKAKIP